MLKPTPMRFNPDSLARDTTQYHVELPLAQFTRLSEALCAPDGQMQATFRFSRRKDTIVAKGQLLADFPLLCQRCLEPMLASIDEPFELVFARNENAARAMPEDLDPVVLDEHGQIHVVDLFEDELILHLPTVPRHASSDECQLFMQKDEQPDKNKQTQKAPARNPFAVLKNLDLH